MPVCPECRLTETVPVCPECGLTEMLPGSVLQVQAGPASTWVQSSVLSAAEFIAILAHTYHAFGPSTWTTGREY